MMPVSIRTSLGPVTVQTGVGTVVPVTNWEAR